MKILLFQLIGVGGTQLYLSQLTQALSQNNDLVVLLGRSLYEKKHYEGCNAKIISLDTEPSYFKMFLKLINPITYYNILKIITNENPDVIHLVFEDSISGITFFILRLKGKKLIFTEHDPSFHMGESFIVKLNQSFAKLLARNAANAIIVHGEKQKEILEEKGVRSNRIHVVPHGDYSYYTKWEDQIVEEQNSVLFFGIIRDYKGLNYLIQAAPLITPFIPSLKIIIAGDGDITKYHDSIKDKSRFEIHNRFIQDEEVASFFQRASVVVLPYIDASQSGIVPIAYAFKKPVIVTDVGSISEVVDDGITGFVIPPRNAKALASSIIKILTDDSMRRNMGENSYKKMKNDFSWYEVAEKTTNLYKFIIGDL